MIYVPPCLRANMSYMPTSLCADVSMRPNFSLCTNMPINVPMCHTTCHCAIKGMTIFQLGVSTCKKKCQFFKHSSYEMLRKSLYYYYYITNLTLYLIIVIHIICICIIRKNCIMLHFYASFHIKEKCVEFLFLINFSRNENIKRSCLYLVSICYK